MSYTVEHGGQTHEIPDHISVKIGGDYTLEHAQQEFISGLQPAETPVDEDPNLGDPGEDQNGDQNGDQTDTNGAPADDSELYKRYEYEDDASFRTALSKVKGLDERERMLEEREKEIESRHQDQERYASILDEFENPFADDEEAMINSYKKASGVKDRDTIGHMVSATREQLMENPVLAMALAKVAQNSEIGKTFKLADVMGRIEREYTRKGVDFSDTESVEYKDMLQDALESVQLVEKYRSEIGAQKNSVSLLLQNREKAEEAIREKLPSIKTELSKLGLKELKHNFDGREISLEAPKDLTQAIPEGVLRHLAQTLDVSTKEGRDALKSAVNDYLLISQVKDGSFAKAIWSAAEKQITAAAEEKATRLKMNGGSKLPDRSGKAGKVVQAPIEMEIAEAIAKKTF